MVLSLEEEWIMSVVTLVCPNSCCRIHLRLEFVSPRMSHCSACFHVCRVVSCGIRTSSFMVWWWVFQHILSIVGTFGLGLPWWHTCMGLPYPPDYSVPPQHSTFPLQYPICLFVYLLFVCLFVCLFVYLPCYCWSCRCMPGACCRVSEVSRGMMGIFSAWSVWL